MELMLLIKVLISLKVDLYAISFSMGNAIHHIITIIMNVIKKENMKQRFYSLEINGYVIKLYISCF